MNKIYHIRIRGHLDTDWTHELAGMILTPQENGTTILRGLLADQSTLRRVLNQLDDLGLTLLELVLLAQLPDDATVGERRLRP